MEITQWDQFSSIQTQRWLMIPKIMAPTILLFVWVYSSTAQIRLVPILPTVEDDVMR